MGAAVDVMWTDGKKYGGHFRGQVQHPLYELRFRDGDDTVVTAERQEFYHPDDDLPNEVRIQLGKQLSVPAQNSNRQHVNRPAGIQS